MWLEQFKVDMLTHVKGYFTNSLLKNPNFNVLEDRNLTSGSVELVVIWIRLPRASIRGASSQGGISRASEEAFLAGGMSSLVWSWKILFCLLLASHSDNLAQISKAVTKLGHFALLDPGLPRGIE